MKFFILFVALVHAFIHLVGFVNGTGLARAEGFSGHSVVPLSKTAAQLFAFTWLVIALLMLTAVVTFLLQKAWLPYATAGLILSQALILIYWPEAKWGTLVNLFLAVVTIVCFASQKFSTRVRSDASQLLAQAHRNEKIITEEMLASLPLPVRNWLLHAGVVGKEIVHSVRLKQEGWMRTKPEQKKWDKTIAEQYISISEPAFVWRVKMNMLPLLPMVGYDRFINGNGSMQIKLAAVFNVVNQSGSKIDEGALQRWLAEICWTPSAALSRYMK